MTDREYFLVHILLFLLGIGLLYLTYNSNKLPLAEDAYIMLRYAKNLAAGFGLTWNPGMNPVEGATAFLWTILLALGFRLGFPFETTIFLLNSFFIISIMALLYWATVWLFNFDYVIGFLIINIVAVSSLVVQIRAGFETPMYSFFMTLLMIALAILIFKQNKIKKLALYFTPLVGLLLSLTRPEGVVIFLISILAVFFVLTPEEKKEFVKAFLGFFLLPGLIYFLWRWWYFGYFLPNTFYAKVLLGQNLINTAFTIRMSVAYFSWLVKITFPYFLAWGLFLINADKKLRRRFLILLIPVLVCPLLYFFFQQFQNIAHRYQIAILPSSLFLLAFSLHHLEKLASGSLIVNGGLFGLAIFCSFIWFPKTLTSWVLFLIFLLYFISAFSEKIIKNIFFTQPLKKIILVAIGILLLFNTYQRESYDTGGDDRVIIGKALQPFAQKGYRMVCSEAGCLSFYSDWITFDPFGLTDEYITHHGLTFEYLEKIKPDLIMFHSSKNLIRISKNELWEKNHQRTSWGLMLRRLYNYAEEKKYVLAAAIRKGGRDNDIHWYYVRPDCPDKTIIIKVITNQNNLSYYKKNRAA